MTAEPVSTAGEPRPASEPHVHSFVLQQGATCRCGAEAAQGAAPRAEGLHERLLAILEAIPWSQPDYYSSRELADEIIARLSAQGAAPRAEGPRPATGERGE